MMRLNFLFLNIILISTFSIFSTSAQAQPLQQNPEVFSFSQFNITKVANTADAALRMAYDTCNQINMYLNQRVQNLNMNCNRAIRIQNKQIKTPAKTLFMSIVVFDLFSKRGISTGEITGKIHFENIRAKSLSELLSQIKSYCGGVQYTQNQMLAQARIRQTTSSLNQMSSAIKGALICEAQDIDSSFDSSKNEWLFESGVLVLDILQAPNMKIY